MKGVKESDKKTSIFPINPHALETIIKVAQHIGYLEGARLKQEEDNVALGMKYLFGEDEDAEA